MGVLINAVLNLKLEGVCVCKRSERGTQAGAWEQGTQLMGWLKRLGVDVVAHPPVASALASEVGALLAPLLAAAFPGGACGHYSLSPKVPLFLQLASSWSLTSHCMLGHEATIPLHCVVAWSD